MARKSTRSRPRKLLKSVHPTRRSLLKVALAGAAVYSVPVLASFSMRKSSLGEAAAFGAYGPYQCFITNQSIGPPQAALDGPDLKVIVPGGLFPEGAELFVQASVAVLHACRHQDGAFPPGRAFPPGLTSRTSKIVRKKFYAPALGGSVTVMLRAPSPRRRCPPPFQSVVVWVRYMGIEVVDPFEECFLAAEPTMLSAKFFDI